MSAQAVPPVPSVEALPDDRRVFHDKSLERLDPHDFMVDICQDVDAATSPWPNELPGVSRAFVSVFYIPGTYIIDVAMRGIVPDLEELEARPARPDDIFCGPHYLSYSLHGDVPEGTVEFLMAQLV